MNKNFVALFLVIGVVMGLLLTWQIRSGVPLESNFLGDEVQAREDLLKSFLDEQSYLQSRIVILRKELEEAQNSVDLQTEVVNFELLDELKKLIGLTEITGPGLEILLDDSPAAERKGATVSDASLVQASDIRDIVNILNAARADGISVNNQRIIATSPISSLGPTILINNSPVAPPFTISAVGDSEIMLQRLLNESLFPEIYERRKKSNIVFEIYKKNRLTIPIYNNALKVDYLNLVEE